MTGLSSVLSKVQATRQTTVANDMTRRFVYAGGTPMMSCSPRSSGISANPITGGQLHCIVPQKDAWLGTFNDFKQRHDTIERIVSPQENIIYLYRKFVEGEADLGLRELKSLFRVEHRYSHDESESFDLAFDYFNIIHPKLNCPFGLEDIFISRAPGNLAATHYQACPTCRLADLQSTACDERIQAASQHLDAAVFQQLREELIDACQATIAFAQLQVSITDGELEASLRGAVAKNARTEVDHIYLSMLHRKADEKAEREMQQQITIASATAQAVLQQMQNTAAVPALGTVSVPTPVVGQPVEAVTVETPEPGSVILSAEEAAEYEAYQRRKAQMAKAREAKTTNAVTTVKDDE